jgi:hypothetical protein
MLDTWLRFEAGTGAGTSQAHATRQAGDEQADRQMSSQDSELECLSLALEMMVRLANPSKLFIGPM